MTPVTLPKETPVQVFENTYAEYHEAIFRFIFLQTKNRETALDITADAFMKLWDYVKKDQEIENIRALVYRIAKNALIDLRRKKRAESLDSLAEEGFDPTYTDTDREIMELGFDTEKLYSILDSLPPDYKEILILRYIEQIPLSELALSYEEAPGTTSVRLHRALKKARNLYELMEKSYEYKP